MFRCKDKTVSEEKRTKTTNKNSTNLVIEKKERKN